MKIKKMGLTQTDKIIEVFACSTKKSVKNLPMAVVRKKKLVLK
ncbi:hypothetical protein LLJM4_02925 [Lactococcus cremoris]|nr:hypothetical protein LLJM4_02925 [Lactococcus cremoris]